MLRQNAWYFIAFTIFIIVGGLLWFNIEQGDTIHFFSGRRTFFGDMFFRYFTKMGEEIVYFIILFFLLFMRFGYALMVPFLGLAVTIISFTAKTYFSQPRPGLYFETLKMLESINLIDGVQLHNGLSSFPSGHTMSAFALYTFFALCWKNKKWGGLLMFTIALLVGVSRIYLVQHFFRDIYVGAIFGVIIAVLFYQLTERLQDPSEHWRNRRLRWKS